MKDVSAIGLILTLFEKFKTEISEQFQSGPPGKDGQPGLMGPRGKPGEKGDKGDKGDPGPKGDIGPAGKDGLDGLPGVDGKDGARGFKGDTGDKGDRGDPGPKGDKGNPGQIGKPGPKGEKGDKGDPGPKGERGEQGFPGFAGKDGRDGIDGRDGVDGKDGERGLPGLKGDKGDPGEKGDKGEKGDPGQVPDIQPHLDNLNRWRENVNKSLASLGGGGSYSILDNKDVEKKPLSTIANQALLVYNINKKKFVVTDLQEILSQFQTSTETMYNRLIDVDGTTTYIGEALPGTALSASSWRIKRIVTVGDDTSIMWADGSAEFDFVWNDRLTYTYS